MDNYRELKIRCDPGFGHLRLFFYSFARNFMRKSFGEIFLLEEL